MMNGLMAPPGDEHAISDACTRSIDRLFRGRCGGGLAQGRRSTIRVQAWLGSRSMVASSLKYETRFWSVELVNRQLSQAIELG
jgi:hypothetical protein